MAKLLRPCPGWPKKRHLRWPVRRRTKFGWEWICPACGQHWEPWW